MNLPKPIGERVLIELGEFPEESRSIIVTPEAHKKRFTRLGTIRDVGSKCKEDLKAGDTVLCYQTVGTELKLNGKEFVLVTAEHIAGIIES